ncbi:MAG: MarR family transcriptional regulator [Gilvibacter sp.]
MGDLAKEIQSSFSSIKVKAMLNIMYTASWINTKQVDFFKPYGISPQQYNILRILRGSAAPMSVKSIKERMIERAPNATRLMDKLCVKNFIERIPCVADRRVVHIAITAAGLKLLAKIDKDFNQDLLENLTDNEAEQLSVLLDKIR